jgi:hypothetical protein
MDHVWACSCCGRQFATLPLDFVCPGPDHWFQIPEAERAKRGRVDSDVCVIDGTDRFIRGCLEIPIIGHDDKFVWGVWTSVSEASMKRIVELWDASVIENEPPRFGWLCNNLSLCPRTMGLKTHLHLRGDGLRPLVELEPTDHRLAMEQRDGIPLERVKEIAAQLMHRH